MLTEKRPVAESRLRPHAQDGVVLGTTVPSPFETLRPLGPRTVRCPSVIAPSNVTFTRLRVRSTVAPRLGEYDLTPTWAAAGAAADEDGGQRRHRDELALMLWLLSGVDAGAPVDDQRRERGDQGERADG